MLEYDCPHCGARLEAPECLRGQDQVCPVCRERTVVPLPLGARSAPAVPAPYVESPKAPAIITIPLLISGVWNCLTAVLALYICFRALSVKSGSALLFFFPLTAAIVVLLIFEVMLYAALNNPARNISPSKVKTIAICEIVAGLLTVAPLVCGIIILTTLGRVDINKGKLPR